MNKLTIRVMRTEQLLEVFEHNEKLQNDVYDDAIDNEMFYIGEILDTLKPALRDWSVGQGGRCYVDVKSPHAFINAVVTAQDESAMLDDDGDKFLRKAVEAVERLYAADTSTEEYDVLDELVDGYAEVLATLVGKAFDETFRGINYEACKGYFVDFYAEERLDGDEYVELREDGSSDWRLKKSVIKTF